MKRYAGRTMIAKAFCFVALLGILPAAFAEDLVVAKDGKTDYQIVTTGRIPKDVWNAKFLAWFLKEKTGAEFPIVPQDGASSNKPHIFIGITEPVKKLVGQLPYAGMRDEDHIVKSIGRDIVLYGKGHDADFYAITEFLDRKFGIRWYQKWVPPKIEKTSTLILQPFDYKGAWALKIRQLGQADFSDYYRGETSYRRDMVYGRSPSKRSPITEKPKFSLDDCSWVEIQPLQMIMGQAAHTPYQYFPRGQRPGAGYPFIENRDYFKTNPEYFALVSGGRYPGLLCFGNRGLRNEYTRNIEKHFDAVGSDDVAVGVNYEDDCSSTCECADCQRLKKEYGGVPGGPYFDYLIELGEYFRGSHPRATILGTLYRTYQTQKPPTLPAGRQFPKNIIFNLAIVEDYTNKDWDDPHNKASYEDLETWSKLTENIFVMTYTQYGPLSFLPFDNVNVMAGWIRKIAGLKISGLFFEWGHFSSGVGNGSPNFADLKLYLFYRLCKDPSLDLASEIHDFMEHVYGPASTLVEKYHGELMKATTTDNQYGIGLGGGGDTFDRQLSYLTLERLHDWSKAFDEMEKQAATGKPLYRDNVKGLRYSLDMAVYGRWPGLAEKYPDYFKDPKVVRDRIGPLMNHFFAAPAKEYLDQAEVNIKYMGKAKALPAQFKDVDPARIVRKTPINTQYAGVNKVPKVVDDPDAAFGYGASVDNPNLPFTFGFDDFANRKQGPRGVVAEGDIEPGKYKLYHLGEIEPSQKDCRIWFSGKSCVTSLQCSTLYDFKETTQKWDAWVSLKFPKDYTGKDTDLVLCDQIILIRK